MTWRESLPGVLLLAALFLAPGALVLLCARAKVVDLVCYAPLVSGGILGVAVEVASIGHLSWQLRTVVILVAVLTAGAGVAAGLLRWASGWRGARTRADSHTSGAGLPRGALPRGARLRGGLLGSGVTLGLLALCAASIGSSVKIGIGPARSLSQSFDAAFHLNAIQAVARTGNPSGQFLSAISDPGTPGRFYPPLFHDVAALLVSSGGQEPGQAANSLVLVLVAVLWPCSVLALVRACFGASRFAAALGLLAASALPLFPGLLLSFGVLWPNALSIATLPALVAALLVLVRHTRYPAFPWPVALLVLGLGLIGTYFAHPGGLFVLTGLGVVIGLASVLRWCRPLWRRGVVGKAGAVVIVLVACGLLRLGWSALDLVPGLSVVRDFRWGTIENMPQAVGEALTLASNLTPPVYLLGALVVVGFGWAVRRRMLRWLAWAHVLLVWLFVLAAGDSSDLAHEATGFWYNDRERLSAVLPVTAIPLVVAGGLVARHVVLSWARTRGRVRVRRAIAASSVLVLLGTALLLPWDLGRSQVSEIVAKGYHPSDFGAPLSDNIADPAKEQLYRTIVDLPQPGLVVGNPWHGEVYAGVVSNRQVVFAHLIGILDPDRIALKDHFRDYQSDPQVCRIVTRLQIAYAVDSTGPYYRNDPSGKDFPGLNNLGTARGLTPVASDGTTTIYRVAPCSG